MLKPLLCPAGKTAALADLLPEVQGFVNAKKLVYPAAAQALQGGPPSHFGLACQDGTVMNLCSQRLEQ